VSDTDLLFVAGDREVPAPDERGHFEVPVFGERIDGASRPLITRSQREVAVDRGDGAVPSSHRTRRLVRREHVVGQRDIENRSALWVDAYDAYPVRPAAIEYALHRDARSDASARDAVARTSVGFGRRDGSRG
jgi:hypothetical protein